MLQLGYESDKGAVRGSDELVVTKTTLIEQALLVGFVMRLPASTKLLLKSSHLIGRQETASFHGIGKIGIVRSNHMNPYKKSVRQTREYFPPALEAFTRPKSH